MSDRGMAGAVTSVTLRLGGAYLIGAVPFANIVAQISAGQDLRLVGNGTVSATGVYGVAGPRAFAMSCALDIGKGALAVSLAGGCAPAFAATAAGLAVAGHNWSPFLRGAGGRGVLPGIGALLLTAPSGSALLLSGLAAGWSANNTALGCFAAQSFLVPLLGRAKGRKGVMLGAAVAGPMLVKRVLGNQRPAGSAWSDRRHAYLTRVLYDREPGPCSPGGQPRRTEPRRRQASMIQPSQTGRARA